MTDCRSLFDAVSQIQPSVTEKRTLIDIMSIRQTLTQGGLRWCPTEAQLADGLTKVSFRLMIHLAAIMGNPRVSIREIAKPHEVRKVAAAVVRAKARRIGEASHPGPRDLHRNTPSPARTVLLRSRSQARLRLLSRERSRRRRRRDQEEEQQLRRRREHLDREFRAQEAQRLRQQQEREQVERDRERERERRRQRHRDRLERRRERDRKSVV